MNYSLSAGICKKEKRNKKPMTEKAGALKHDSSFHKFRPQNRHEKGVVLRDGSIPRVCTKDPSFPSYRVPVLMQSSTRS